MTKKVITLMYSFDRKGNPENLALEVDGDNVFVEDDTYLKQFARFAENQSKLSDNGNKQVNPPKLVKI